MISGLCDSTTVIILLRSYNLNQHLAFPNCFFFPRMVKCGLAYHGKSAEFNELRKTVKTLDNCILVCVPMFLGKCLPSWIWSEGNLGQRCFSLKFLLLSSFPSNRNGVCLWVGRSILRVVSLCSQSTQKLCAGALRRHPRLNSISRWHLESNLE